MCSLFTRTTRNLRRFIMLILEDFFLNIMKRNLGSDVRDEV